MKTIKRVSLFIFILFCSILKNESQTLWLYDMGSISDKNERFNAIVVKGNYVYLTGCITTEYEGLNIYTAKLDKSDGSIVWDTTFDGQDGLDSSLAIAVDDDGNVYVTGTTYVADTDLDYLVIKYNSNGVQQWFSTRNGTDSLKDIANSIAVNNNHEVFVTGFSCSTPWGFDPWQPDYWTVKFSSNGGYAWDQRYDQAANQDVSRAIVLDENSNVYITGYSYGDEYGDCTEAVTISYSSSGNVRWTNVWSSYNVDYSYDGGKCITLLGDYIYIGGYTNVANESDYLTIKYDKDSGVVVWTAIYNGTGNDVDDVNAIVVDSSENVYVTGYSGGQGYGQYSYDYVTIKYDSYGDDQWVSRYDGTGYGVDAAIDIDFKEYNDTSYVYVTGYSYGDETLDDIVTIKYSANNGSDIWTHVLDYYGYEYPASDFERYHPLSAMAIDDSNGIYICGISINTSYSNSNAIVYKIDPSTQDKFTSNKSNNVLEKFKLSQNYPNPFNPKTLIEFSIPQAGNVNITVFDVLGREVEILVNDIMKPGSYKVDFNGSNIASGVYFYTIKVNDFTATRKMLLIK